MRSVAVRAHPLVFGTVVFLASESMLFAALLAAYYYLRGDSATWPPAGATLDVAGMAIGTALLGLGSVTMAVAQAAAMRRGRVLARVMLATTIVLAIGFLALEWADWRSANFWVNGTAYATIFYVLTGTHFAHVAAGVVLLAAVAIFLRMPAFTREHHAGVEAVAYYWHFVFVVWLALYATIFLIR
ncbi:MAG: cytochrome c oxidase subunit [Candidatus Eremiobacteraeota bacterium]|nr:cytochrome c oxidase subunit [Candidatus Eremiobacteraeota bacterium]